MQPKRGKCMKKLIGIGALSFWCALEVLGAPVGSISGTVKDSTGALVPNVRLTLTSTTTNAQITTQSNQQGEFQFLNLPPTTYALVAEVQGFKKSSVGSVLVQVDQITHLDLTLEVGNITESIQVEAVAPLLENDKSTLSTVVDNR